MKFKNSLTGQKIKLQFPKPGDAKLVVKKINFKTIARWTSNIPYPYKLADAKKFIIKQKINRKKGSDLVYFIFDKNNSDLIGGIGLHHLDKKNHKAELGYWLTPQRWGEGLTSEAVSLLVDYGFKSLALVRIYAVCFSVNLASKKVLEKNGFIFEGVELKSLYKDGK